MLQQILKDMYIDPDVLEALNEDQKKTLFLKMRQEQVRRWTEREEREGGASEPLKATPKTANSKHVSWQLGRDGDVAVMVIGEVDELKSSKLICSALGGRRGPGLLTHTGVQTSALKSSLVNRENTTPARAGRDNLPPRKHTGVQLHLKGNTEAQESCPPLQVAAASEQPTSPAEEQGEEPHKGEEPTLAVAGAATPKEREVEKREAEEKSSFTRYRPHIRVVPAALRHIGSLPCPDPAPAAPAPAPPAPGPSPTLTLASSQSLTPASSQSPTPPSSQSLTPAFSQSLTPASSLAKTLPCSLAPSPAPSLVPAPVPAPVPSLVSAPAPSLVSAPAPSLALAPTMLSLASTLPSAPAPSPAPTPTTRSVTPASGATAAKTRATPDPPPSQAPSTLTARLHPQQPQEPLPPESQGSRDQRVITASHRCASVESGPAEGGGAGGGAGRGRVAQLMKTFSVQSPAPPAQALPPRGNKPPIPTKPSHLRLMTTPSLR